MPHIIYCCGIVAPATLLCTTARRRQHPLDHWATLFAKYKRLPLFSSCLPVFAFVYFADLSSDVARTCAANVVDTQECCVDRRQLEHWVCAYSCSLRCTHIDDFGETGIAVVVGWCHSWRQPLVMLRLSSTAHGMCQMVVRTSLSHQSSRSGRHQRCSLSLPIQCRSRGDAIWSALPAVLPAFTIGHGDHSRLDHLQLGRE